MDKKEYQKQYYLKNKEKKRQKYLQNREEKIEYMKQRSSTQLGRASMLLSTYNKEDKKYDRGHGDLTAHWIVENIFSKPCAHCGKTGWKTIGCNRLDNSKPHTKDNVEPCCKHCNFIQPKK